MQVVLAFRSVSFRKHSAEDRLIRYQVGLIESLTLEHSRRRQPFDTKCVAFNSVGQ
jgi:hypothetical protein